MKKKNDNRPPRTEKEYLKSKAAKAREGIKAGTSRSGKSILSVADVTSWIKKYPLSSLSVAALVGIKAGKRIFSAKIPVGGKKSLLIRTGLGLAEELITTFLLSRLKKAKSPAE